jgi:hypothetical protein
MDSGGRTGILMGKEERLHSEQEITFLRFDIRGVLPNYLWLYLLVLMLTLSREPENWRRPPGTLDEL